MNYKTVSFASVSSLEELERTWILARQKGLALRFLAGGTDLMVELRSPGQGLKIVPGYIAPHPCLLADLSIWGELKQLKQAADGTLSVGALCTHAQLADSLPPWAQILAQAARSVGSPQIRYRGTIGGNCANGAPAADTPPALVLLDAQAELAVCREEGVIQMKLPLLDFLKEKDHYGDALLLRLCIPTPNFTGCRAFFKQGKRSALAISTVSLAVEAKFSAAPDGALCVEKLRFVTGAVTAVPFVFAASGPMQLSGRNSCMNYAAALSAEAIAAMDRVYGPRASRRYKQQVITSFLYKFLSRQEGVC